MMKDDCAYAIVDIAYDTAEFINKKVSNDPYKACNVAMVTLAMLLRASYTDDYDEVVKKVSLALKRAPPSPFEKVAKQ